jgi:hypothetical protein
MTNKPIFGLTLAFVASLLACATPNKYNPTDSSSDEPDGPAGPLPDGAVAPDRVASSDVGAGGDASIDQPSAPADAPVESDGPRPDGLATLPIDGNAPPPDLKPLPPDTGTPPPPTDACGSASDVHNCGSCGHDCTQLPNVKPGATVTCQAGHCSIPVASCTTGHGHCGSSPADNGCETDISVPATCGCTACGSGQVCTGAGGQYQCSCPGLTAQCNNACADLQSDSLNCGTCGHSCLGGTCESGSCKPVRIYAGADIQTDTPQFVLNDRYLYFRRIRTPTTTVLARILKTGGTVDDLTDDDMGAIYGGLGVTNGRIYWPKDNSVHSCALPACSSRTELTNQATAQALFSDSSGSVLFWGALSGGNLNLMTSPTSPRPLASPGPFNVGVADGAFAYLASGSSPVALVRVGLDGVTQTIGNARGDLLAANSRSLFVLQQGDQNTDGGTWPGLFKYDLSKAGTPQQLQSLGFDVGGEFGLSAVADDTNVYWLTALAGWKERLVRCRAVGCGPSPTLIQEMTVSFPQGWLGADSQAVYWVSDQGIFKVAKP